MSFPQLHQEVGLKVNYLNAEIVRQRSENTLIVSWENYLRMASDAGIVENEEVERATQVLEQKVDCSTGIIIPTTYRSLSHTHKKYPRSNY